MLAVLTGSGQRATGVAALLLLAALPVPAFAQSKQTVQGVLVVKAGDEIIGRERYKLSPRGNTIEVSGTVELQVGTESLRQSSRMTLSANGEPRSYEWKMEGPDSRTIKVEFDGGSAFVDFPRTPIEKGMRDSQEFRFASARVALLDNNFFHHYILLVRLYDFTSGGPQTLPVLIPQSVQPGKITVEDAGLEDVQTNAGIISARRLDITSPDNLIHMWLDEGNRFVRLTVPAAGVTVEPE